MKIAYFTDTYEPQINGVVTSIKMSAKNLRRNGHEVYIFCPSGSKKNKHVYQIFSKKFINYPEYKVSFPSFDLIKKIKKIKPDIIHIHTPVTIGITGLSIARLLNIPVVITYHTLLKDYMSYITSNDVDKFTDIYTSWFFNKSTIIVPTKSIKRILRKSKIKKPIKVLPNPIDENIIDKKIKRKNKRLKILHVGRLCKEKRIEIVLRAFKNILKNIDAELTITSSGPYENRLKDLARSLGINEKVRFTGYLPIEKLKKLYSSSDIFVSASDTETQGLVVLEAMVNGCPVIARNALGFKDIIKNNNNGLLFDDEHELSRKIILLSKNKKLRDRIIREGLKTAEKFSSENYVKEIEDIYNENLGLVYGLRRRIGYSFLLIFNFLTYWFIKNMDLSINSRLVKLYLRFVRMMLKFGT